MDDASEALRDAGYTLVGLGVLWFQRAMVLRRELSQELPDLTGVCRPVAGAVRGAAGVVRSVLEGRAPPAAR